MPTVVVVVGCGQDPAEGAPGSAGTTAASANGAAHAEPVSWNAAGVMDGRFGIDGVWYTYNDIEAATEAGLASTIPDPGLVGPYGQFPRLGWSISPNRVCMKGIVPAVARGADTTLAYDQQWGAGVAFDFKSDFEPYDASALTGFMFDITQGTPGPPAPPTLEIGITMPSTEPDAGHFITIILPSLDQVVSFAEMEQGRWVTEPRPFTSEAIGAVTFQVIPNTQAPRRYDFCVSNFRVLL